MRTRDSRGLAIHEAAHAVAARRLGLRVGVVSLRPPRGFDGWCYVTAVNLTARRGPVLLMTLAGPWAEGRHLHLPGDVLPPGSESDLAAALRLSRELGGDHWGRTLGAAFRDVAELLNEADVQAQVAAVARQLLVQPVLTDRELAAGTQVGKPDTPQSPR